MRKTVRVPQWIPTALLVVLIPVIGYLAVVNIEATRSQQARGVQDDADARAIVYMSERFGSQYPARGYQWSVGRRDGSTRLVCYCNKKGYGWWYSVTTAPDGRFSAVKVADTSNGGAPP